MIIFIFLIDCFVIKYQKMGSLAASPCFLSSLYCLQDKNVHKYT